MKKIMILIMSFCGSVYANTDINIDSKIDTTNHSINMNDLATVREQSENTSIEDLTSQLSVENQEQIYSSITNDDLAVQDQLANSIDTSNLTEEQKNTIAQESQDKGDDECGIWLCLPQGFITDSCSGPHRAMIKRIIRHKSALPSFSGCSKNANVTVANDNAQITSKEGIAAYVPTYSYCAKYETKTFYPGSKEYDSSTGFHGIPQTKTECVENKTANAHYVKDTKCVHAYDNQGRTTYWNPKNCTKTVNYAEIQINNEIFGEPYYFEVK